MKRTITITIAAFILAAFTLGGSGCQSTNTGTSSGTHRMGNPKENYQMSNESMPKRR